MPPELEDDLDLTTADRGDDVSPLQDAGKGPEDEEEEEELELPAAESDEEEEEEGEGEEEEEEETEEKPKKRIRIPKERFDEALSKARSREEALNQRIAELEGRIQTGAKKAETSEMQTQLEELQDKYEEFLVDGDRTNAKKIRAQIDKLRDDLIDARTSAKSDAARKAAIEELKYDSLLAKLEGDYADINPDSENYSQEKTEEVGVLLEAFVARGFTRHSALEKAVKYVLGPVKKEPTDDSDVIREERATKARKKTADAVKKQPPSTTKIGVDSDKAGAKNAAGVDILRLSQDQFAELDEKTLAQLRGDDV